MKPKTRTERQLAEWSRRMPPLTAAQRKHAYSLFDSIGYYWKNGKVWCQCCGHVEHRLLPELAVSLELDGEICPGCGASLRLRHWREGSRENAEEKLFSIVRTCREWTVTRTFSIRRYNRAGRPTEYYADEIYQNWISPDGRGTILGRKYTRTPFSLRWDYGSPMDIKHHNASASGYYAFDDMFCTEGNHFYPRATVTPLLRRNGWDARILKMGVSVPEAMRRLLASPAAETLAKQGQWEVFRHMVRRGDWQIPYLYALNICHRHGYAIRDASLWFDYMDLLAWLGLDTHNPRYICPADLHAAHDSLVRRKQQAEARLRQEQRRQEMAKAEPGYHARIARFLGILITDGRLEIRPIPTVTDVFEEGRAMHHCVYDNAYHERPGCLLLSARMDGKRLETVEVSLRTFSVMQSRGPCNRLTAHHDRIVQLVRDNMGMIRHAAEAAPAHRKRLTPPR